MTTTDQTHPARPRQRHLHPRRQRRSTGSATAPCRSPATGVWGEPADRAECVRTVRRAVELGVDLIDTADSYGPEVSETSSSRPSTPIPTELLIATKAGLTRQGPGQWLPVGRPEYLRQQCEMSLRRLGVETIDLFQLHRIDAKVPADEQFGLLADLIDEGKVRGGRPQPGEREELEAALAVVPVVSVQNLYNLTDRSSEDVLDHCEAEGIGFIPWFPIAAGALASPGGPVDAVVKETGATPVPGGPGLAAPPLSGDAAHPRHQVGRGTWRRTAGRPHST